MGIDSFKEAVSQGTPESLLREEIEGKRRLYTALAGGYPAHHRRWSVTASLCAPAAGRCHAGQYVLHPRR